MSNIGYTFECEWCSKKINYIETNDNSIQDAILVKTHENTSNDISINEQCRTIYEILKKKNIRICNQKTKISRNVSKNQKNKNELESNMLMNNVCSSNVSYSRIPHNLNILQIKDRVMGYDYKNDTYCLAWIQSILQLEDEKRQILIHYEDWGRKWDQWFIIGNDISANSIKPRSEFYHYSRFIVNGEHDRYFSTSIKEQMLNYGMEDGMSDVADAELAMMHVSLKKQKHCFSVISKNSSLFVEEFTKKQIAIFNGSELNLDPCFMSVVSVVGGVQRELLESIVFEVFPYLGGMDMDLFEYIFYVCGCDVQVFVMALKALKTPNKIQKYYDLLLLKQV